MKASVREVKGNLSKYLRSVKAGAAVVVTSRGKPIARLVGVAPEPVARIVTAAELKRRLKAISGMIPGEGAKPRGSRRPLRIRAGEKTLSEIVLEDRR